MDTYTIPPRRGRGSFDIDEYTERARESYSIAHIRLTDGTEQEFMVKASPTVVPHLLKEMKNTGYLTLWNDTDTLCIRADHVKQITMREVTNQPTEK